jgi:hypothetical protein
MSLQVLTVPNVTLRQVPHSLPLGRQPLLRARVALRVAGAELLEGALGNFALPDKFAFVVGHIWRIAIRLVDRRRSIRLIVVSFAYGERSGLFGPVDTVEQELLVMFDSFVDSFY